MVLDFGTEMLLSPGAATAPPEPIISRLTVESTLVGFERINNVSRPGEVSPPSNQLSLLGLMQFAEAKPARFDALATWV